ncbi:MAG: hypothetical protein DME99_02855 [Verrucomicrobia bacterium]|nr:MAG: hypothetical protein DME99_02855 [Verrucomicrobiota bacterium]
MELRRQVPPRNVCVGIVPLGTANDFARSMGLMGDINAIIDILQARATARIDLVRMTSQRTRYFVNASSGGFSGVVDEKLTPEIKISGARLPISEALPRPYRSCTPTARR